jgi:hypothetical protein
MVFVIKKPWYGSGSGFLRESGSETLFSYSIPAILLDMESYLSQFLHYQSSRQVMESLPV